MAVSKTTRPPEPGNPRAQRRRPAGQDGDVTVRAVACPPDSATPLRAPTPRKGYGFAARIGRGRALSRPAPGARCRSPRAELDPATGLPVLVDHRPHHPECARYVAVRAEHVA
jgi:hypothetical protein